MVYPKEFFTLMFEYARRYSEISGEELGTVLLRKVPFYYVIGNHNWDIDESNSLWLEYVEGLNSALDPVNLAYDMYIQHLEPEGKHKYFGCFRYKCVEDSKTNEKIVKLHFENNDKSPYGPLSHQRMDVRLSELREMFMDIKNECPQAQYVQGVSWLYNYDSYKRLYPKAYTESIKEMGVVKTEFLAIWNMFINSENLVREDMYKKFLTDVSKSKSIKELEESIPYKVFVAKAPIESFYKMYGL